MNNKKEKIYKIKEASELLGVHQDTLRNWEKNNTIKPLRVGKRGDRRYTEKMLNDALRKDGGSLKDIKSKSIKLDKDQLSAFLWQSANILRNRVDEGDYKKYIFPLLFYKRISDVWDEEHQKAMDEYNDEEIANEEYNHKIQLGKNDHWENFKNTPAGKMGGQLNKILKNIEKQNKKIENIFKSVDFADRDIFTDEVIQKLVNHFDSKNFSNKNIPVDVLGDVYEIMLKKFADAGGQQYTPRELERLIVNILDIEKGSSVYDPTVGTGGFLLIACEYIKNKLKKDTCEIELYGQEILSSAYSIAKMNMFIHFLDHAEIELGDTLANPKFLDKGRLKKFDYILSNPEYSVKEWEFNKFKTNKYGILDGYSLPPKKNADFAFILHVIESMKDTGKAGIVLPMGVLSRENKEKKIREQIIKNDLIEAVITLPKNLFKNTTIAVCVIILNKNKIKQRQNKIIFIDASREYRSGKNQNFLRIEDIKKITQSFKSFKDLKKYANVVSLKEIEKNNFSLSNYVDIHEKEEVVELSVAIKNAKKAEKNVSESKKEFEKKIKNIKM